MRILIALTGHDIDEDIAATAARMSDPGRDQIVAVHVAHPRETQATYERVESTDTAARAADLSAMTTDRAVSGPTEGAEQATQRLEAEFNDHVKLITGRHLAGFNVEQALIINGDVADGVTDAVDAHAIDAVIMGTRSKRSRLSSALLGSEAEKVLRQVMVPVTVVKEGTVTAAAN